VSSPESWSLRKLGYKFSQPELLQLALTHRSHSVQNNERLEFLGDAVLGTVISEALYRQLGDCDEGDLSRMRANLVRGESLADLAAGLKLGDLLQLGAGESRSGGHHRRSILADSLEAVFGAVFLDGGMETARNVILKLFEQRLGSLPRPDQLKDPKSRLQEALQARGNELPVYTILKETGPAHDRRFEVRCELPQMDIYTTASGSSRRQAEQIAADAALQEVIGQ